LQVGRNKPWTLAAMTLSPLSGLIINVLTAPAYRNNFRCFNEETFLRLKVLLPPPRRMFSSLFVCLSVNNFAQKLPNAFA